MVAGVDHTFYRGKGYNSDGVTDHYITITGRGIDPLSGKKFYLFFDPGRSQKSQGTHTNNKLIEIEEGVFAAETVGSYNKQHYHLASIVKFPKDHKSCKQYSLTSSLLF